LLETKTKTLDTEIEASANRPRWDWGLNGTWDHLKTEMSRRTTCNRLSPVCISPLSKIYIFLYYSPQPEII